MSDSGADAETSTEAAEPPGPGADWSIGPRHLPPPAGASPELRALLEQTVTPVAPAVPGTIEEWMASVAERDEQLSGLARCWARKLDVRVEADTVAGVRVYRIAPPEIAPQHAGHLFVHAHGGAFIQGAGVAGTAEAVQIAAYVKLPVLTVDYRMPPEHPAPAAMDDVVAVWRELIRERPEAGMVLGGTSAGANLALVGTLRLKALGLPLPGALFVGTPSADLAKHGDMRVINEGIDRGLVSWDGLPAKAMTFYAGDGSYDDPYLSPIHGDFTGFPPTYLISGTRDLMLSDTVLVHRKLRRAGVLADLHVYEGIAHAEYVLLMGTPESTEHYAELAAFLRRHLR